MTEGRLGRYRLEELLGSGAFATVHAAHDEQLDDRVAIKVLAHNHAANPEILGRFIAEGQILRRLRSPHLITVHDLDRTDDGRPFLVLEMCDRGSLRQRVDAARASGWRPADADAVVIARALAAAIATLAAADVVHRDLTPSNVLLTTAGPTLRGPFLTSSLVKADERVVVADLGFCKDLAIGTGISVTGGTEGFQPPEQRQLGGRVDVRSDLWAASAVLAWTLTGHVSQTPEQGVAHLTAAGLARPLAEAIAAGLHADPEHRPQTPDAWLAGITEAAVLEEPDPAPGRPSTAPSRSAVWRRPAAAVLVAVTLIVVLLGVLPGGDDPSGAPGDAVAADGAPGTATGPPEGFEQRHGGTWDFQVAGAEGRAWDISVHIDTAFRFGKAPTSPADPGRVHFTAAIDGGTSSRGDPANDSTLLPLSLDFAAVFQPITEGIDIFDEPCRTSRRGAGLNVPMMACRLDASTGTAARPAQTPADYDESDLDELLNALDGQAPLYFAMGTNIHHCDVHLFTDGRVVIPQNTLIEDVCTVTGDTVEPEV
jgi:hypothetical protein